MRPNVIIKYIGIILMVVSAFMLISSGISYYDDVDNGFIPLLYSGIITGVVGLFPTIFVKGQHKVNEREGYLIVVGSWVISCFFGMLPYIMYGGEFSLTNAMFESISGFTTTGASILNNIEALPRGILFWRMSSAWMGGVGVVVFSSLLIPSLNRSDSVLTGVEVSEIARDSNFSRSKSFVHMMIGTYLVLTSITSIALKLAGMNWFDALTHGMSASGTCGFSTKNASIAYFDSPLIEGIIIISMLVASIRFSLLYFSFIKRKNLALKSEVTRYFLAMVAIGSILTTLDLHKQGLYQGWGESFRYALFQVASISTTSGFATDDTNVWPALSISILVICSIICGCSGSTTGGIKMDRILLAARGLKRKVMKLQNPRAIYNIKIDGQLKSDSIVIDAMVFIIFYFVIITAGTLINYCFGADLETGFTGAIACMGNIGPAFGTIGSMSNFSVLPDILKWNAMAMMLIGRLEIFSVIYVLGLRNIK